MDTVFWRGIPPWTAIILTRLGMFYTRTEANKFSTEIHRIHKGGKTTLECSSCHAL